MLHKKFSMAKQHKLMHQLVVAVGGINYAAGEDVQERRMQKEESMRNKWL